VPTAGRTRTERRLSSLAALAEPAAATAARVGMFLHQRGVADRAGRTGDLTDVAGRLRAHPACEGTERLGLGHHVLLDRAGSCRVAQGRARSGSIAAGTEHYARGP
jgi:hypothetical protein